MKKILLILGTMALCMQLSACSSTFKMKDKNVKLVDDKIVVLSGDDSDIDLILSLVMAMSLHEKSNFKVMSPEDIKKNIEGYPVEIQGPFRETYTSIKTDWKNTDVDSLRKYASQCNVRYVLVSWITHTIQYQEALNETYVVTQLYQFPECKEIGRANFKINWVDPNHKGLVIATADSKKFDVCAKYYCDNIAEEIAETTGMLKEPKN